MPIGLTPGNNLSEANPQAALDNLLTAIGATARYADVQVIQAAIPAEVYPDTFIYNCWLTNGATDGFQNQIDAISADTPTAFPYLAAPNTTFGDLTVGTIECDTYQWEGVDLLSTSTQPWSDPATDNTIEYAGNVVAGHLRATGDIDLDTAAITAYSGAHIDEALPFALWDGQRWQRYYFKLGS